MKNKMRIPNTEQRVLQYILENQLTQSGQKILVAVSGGPDSVCLLHILNDLQKTLNINLHVAHLNHGLRAEESESDALYVENLSRKLGIPATIDRRDVLTYQKQHSLSLEEAAREVRYIFLAQVAMSVGASRVAVGHTRSDQVETILLHLIRGTGIRGLRGLQPCQTLQFSGIYLTVIRPLLEVPREETERYCMRRQLNPCADTSNSSLSLLRNRVRRQLLPLLQDYNSGIKESILRLGKTALDDLAFLESESARIQDQVMVKQQNTFILNKKMFRSLPPALQRHLLRRVIDGLLGTLKDIEMRHIEYILEALDKPAGRQISLPEGLIFSIDYDRYLLSCNPEEVVPFPEITDEYELHVPGQTFFPGWSIVTTVKLAETAIEPSEGLVVPQKDTFSACFDKEKVGSKILVRARRKGDWFQPLGMNQAKKVGEFMLDAQIPQAWRSRIPILSTPQQIIWVAGWRIDERVKVTRQTSEVLCVELVRWVDECSAESRKNS